MQVFQDKHEEVLIFFVELNESQKNIQERVALLAFAFTDLCHLFFVNDGGVITRTILIYHDGTIYPHREGIKQTFFIACF